MEVIHVVLGKANPDRMNGVNKVVHQLATNQVNAGFNVKVWGITANPIHDYPARAYHTELFQAAKFPFTISRALKTAVDNVNSQTVFHLHGGFIPAMYAMAKHLFKNSIPFIFTPHGSYNTVAMKTGSIRKKIYFHLFEKNLLKNAAKIHSLGQSEIIGLNEIFSNKKSVLIPYGFEKIAFVPDSVSRDQFIIGFCGRIDIYTKGLAELFRGFEKFNKVHTNSRLWIIGDGPERIKLEHLARELNILDAVIFHGSKYGDEKYSLLKRLVVFAAPSRNEGLPTAVLEAAALGIPCMVTVATNTGEVIKKYDAGEVLDETDEDEIAASIFKLHKRIVEKGQANLLQNNALKMIEKEFNWKTIVKRFQQVYSAA